MIELKMISGVAKGNMIVTNASHVTIGRSQVNMLVIPDRYVSWHHGEILRRGDTYVYRDLSSTHGTVLRREEVERRVERVQLNEGDRLLFPETDSVLAVIRIAPVESTPDDFTLTLDQEYEDVIGAEEEVFANDAKALIAILHLDKAILANLSEVEGPSGVHRALVEQIAESYPTLDYAAVFQESGGQVEVAQTLTLLEKVVPRISSKILQKLSMRKKGFVFEIQKGRLLSLSSQGFQELSPGSAVMEHDTTGICVPLDLDTGKVFYLQMERASVHGKFDRRDLNLVSVLVTRAARHLHHLTIQRGYEAASLQAALGIFAKMLGHDIKNALFFGEDVQVLIRDPSKHAVILLGIEQAHDLALSLESPSRSDKIDLTQFRVGALMSDIALAFSSTYSGLCCFEAKYSIKNETITTHRELLRRVISNLVLNAYAAHYNREIPVLECDVTIRVDSARNKNFKIQVKDNAGGMDEKSLRLFQKSFSSIAEVYQQEEDLIQVVEMMEAEEGVPNRVGLFFAAVAVNDMAGSIMVEPNGNDGTTFTILLPKKIERLKGLLRF